MARFKSYDFGVMGLFIVVIIGVSLSWYTASISLGGRSLGAGVSGWHYAFGVLALVAALAALVFVCLKAALAPGGALPSWYKEGVVVMGLGGLVALFAFVGLFDKPGGIGEVDLFGLEIGYGAGIFLTLVAGFLIVACGYLALRDKPAAHPWAAQAPAAGPGGAGPDGGAARYCRRCGAWVSQGSTFCPSCGQPQ